MSRVIWFATLGVLLGSTRAGAQLCTGAPSFRRPVQVSVGALFNSEAKSLVAGLAVGSHGVFGEGQLGTTYHDALDGSSFDFGAGVGYQLTLDKQARAQVCPMAGVGFVSGPKNIQGSGNGYSETDVQLGLAAGVVVLRANSCSSCPRRRSRTRTPAAIWRTRSESAPATRRRSGSSVSAWVWSSAGR